MQRFRTRTRSQVKAHSCRPRHLGSTGKVAVTIDDQTEAARFVWQRQNLQTDVVTLSGPFALNQTTLERQGSKLFRQPGASRQPTDPIAGTDPISTALTRLPPEAIGYWLLGRTQTTATGKLMLRNGSTQRLGKPPSGLQSAARAWRSGSLSRNGHSNPYHEDPFSRSPPRN